MSDGHLNDLLTQAMRQQIPDGMELELPPKSFVDMEAEIVAFEPGQSLTVRFPVLERYQNPMNDAGRLHFFLSAHATNQAERLVAIGQAVHTAIDRNSE